MATTIHVPADEEMDLAHVRDPALRQICHQVRKDRRFRAEISILKERRLIKDHPLHPDAWSLARWLNSHVFDKKINLHPDFIMWARSCKGHKGRYMGLTHLEFIDGQYIAIAIDLNPTDVNDPASLFNTLVHEMVHVSIPISGGNHGDAYKEEATRVLSIIQRNKDRLPSLFKDIPLNINDIV